MTDSPRPIVLVHGSWCGGWIWQSVARILAADGFQVYAPSLTGLADRSHLFGPDIALSTHVSDIENLIRWERLNDVVLCAHSYGGLVVSAVAGAAAPGVIGSLVYLDAVCSEEGASLFDVLPPPPGALAGSDEAIPPPPAAAFGYEDGSEKARFLAEFLTPQPPGTWKEPLGTSDARATLSSKHYVASKDFSIPIFRDTAARLRADPEWSVQVWDGNHFLMMDFPERTAELLGGIASR